MNLHRLSIAFFVVLISTAAQSIATHPGASFRISPFTSTDTMLSEPALDVRQPLLDQVAISGVCRNTSQDDKDLSTAHIFDVGLRHRIALPVTTNSAIGEEGCSTDRHGCHTCVEHWDGDKCTDNPGVSHHDLNYSPGGGETCWVITRCWCRPGQVPSGQSCGSCRYGGQEVVCRPN